MPGAPVALHKAPLTVHKHSVPGIRKLPRLDLHAGLIAHRLGVALDVNAVHSRVATQAHKERVVGLSAELDAPKEAQGRVRAERFVELDRVEVFDGDPAEDGARLLQVGDQAVRKLVDQLGVRGLFGLGDVDGLLVDEFKDGRVVVQVAFTAHWRLGRRSYCCWKRIFKFLSIS